MSDIQTLDTTRIDAPGRLRFDLRNYSLLVVVGVVFGVFQVLTDGKAVAALAASIFHYGEYPVPVTKKYLAERGVIIRL